MGLIESRMKPTIILGENSLKLSQDSGVVDQYIYPATIVGLTHSTEMKVKQFHKHRTGFIYLRFI